MATADLEGTAKALVADGKGILAADETPPTLTRRFDAIKIDSMPDSRRVYREMFVTTPGVAEFISGVILQDETIHQKSSTGMPLADILAQQGVMPGIKVDTGAKPLAGWPGETITEGLDGLRDRLQEYRYMGALQDEALHAWHGKHENLRVGQRVFYHRAQCVSAAAVGTYSRAMEGELAGA